jgi:hypothetical protein
LGSHKGTKARRGLRGEGAASVSLGWNQVLRTFSPGALVIFAIFVRILFLRFGTGRVHGSRPLPG